MDSEVQKKQIEERVLLLAPTARDAEFTTSFLSRAGLVCTACQNLRELCSDVRMGCGAVLLTEEVVAAPDIGELIRLLESQPAWSDLPLVMLMRGGTQSDESARVLNLLRNVTLLERPTPRRSMVSAVEAAVRARKRQYQARQQIDDIRRAQADLKQASAERDQLLLSEQAARAESERAGRMKDDFLATLSHELRTPLNAILGWSQLIRANQDKNTLQEGLEVIERNARVQVQLIEDLLDMSRVISGKLRLDVKTIDLAMPIEAAIETVMPAAAAKGVRITKVLDSNAGPIAGDAGRLQQVVWNLLSNAVKFTAKGGQIQVLLHRTNSNAEIAISDTGKGIDADFLPHIFERFRQADASTTRQAGGLGLGLAIVKQLVEMHGGTITVASDGAEKGSTFLVALPIPIAHQKHSGESKSRQVGDAKSLPSLSSTDLTGITVLVVDDEKDARGMVKRFLEEYGANVTTAGSAAEAVELLPSVKPDVLVSDIGMPEIDGFELLRRVRGLGRARGGDVPAIALTALARSEDRARALRAGFQVHVAKPVEPHELIATIAAVGNGRRDALKTDRL